MSDIKKFPYKGRIIVSGPDSTGKNTIVGYQADAAEIARQKQAWGSESVNENLAVVNMLGYIDNKKEKRYDFGSAYDLRPYQGITNAELLSSIANDPNFYKTATGSTSGNTAPVNPNAPGSPGTSQPTTSPPNDKQPITAPSGLIYPEDLASTDQDRIMFEAGKYVAPGTSSRTKVEVTEKVGLKVFLPVQSSLTDQNAVGWEPDTMNPIEQKAVAASLEIMKSGSYRDITKNVGTKFTEALADLRVNSEAVRTYLAGQAVGVNNLLSRLQGQVLNPNLELLFQGPQLRPFSYTFKLSARSSGEAKTIKQIINYFKKYMAPQYTAGDLFIKAPHIFEIKYYYKNQEGHPGLNLVKACALTNFSVDYTPLGSYMTYEDGTMVAYTLSMQFQELIPIYSSDYSGHDIGY